MDLIIPEDQIVVEFNELVKDQTLGATKPEMVAEYPIENDLLPKSSPYGVSKPKRIIIRAKIMDD